MKGTKIEVADDPETIRHKQNTQVSWNKVPEKSNFCFEKLDVSRIFSVYNFLKFFFKKETFVRSSLFKIQKKSIFINF